MNLGWFQGEISTHNNFLFLYTTNEKLEMKLLNVVIIQLTSLVWLFATLWTAGCQAILSLIISWSLPSSCPLSRWWHPTMSSSVIPFSSCLRSFPASGSFPMSQFFSSGGQSIGVSASGFSMNIQYSFPLGWTGWISLQSKGLSNTTVQKHQFFGAQLSLWSNSHMHTWHGS